MSRWSAARPALVIGVGAAVVDDRVDGVLRTHPVEVGTFGGEAADARTHLGKRLRALEAHGIRVESEQQVVVAVDDARGEQPAAEATGLGRGGGFLGAADIADAPAGDADGLGPGSVRVEGAHSCIGEQQIKHGSSPDVVVVSRAVGGAGCRGRGARGVVQSRSTRKLFTLEVTAPRTEPDGEAATAVRKSTASAVISSPGMTLGTPGG